MCSHLSAFQNILNTKKKSALPLPGEVHLGFAQFFFWFAFAVLLLL